MCAALCFVTLLITVCSLPSVTSNIRAMWHCSHHHKPKSNGGDGLRVSCELEMPSYGPLKANSKACNCLSKEYASMQLKSYSKQQIASDPAALQQNLKPAFPQSMQYNSSQQSIVDFTSASQSHIGTRAAFTPIIDCHTAAFSCITQTWAVKVPPQW